MYDLKSTARNWGRVLAMGLLLCAAVAYAADLGELKREGLVGERADGYLGLVRDEVTGEASQLVAQINAKRKAEYQRIAARNQIAVSEVEALAGKKTLEKTAPGGWIYVESWRQKAP